MSKLSQIALSRWSISLLGVVLLAVLVWFFGPFIAWFEPMPPRILIIAVLLLLWGGINFAIDFRHRRRDQALAQGVGGAAADPSAIASAEETALLRDRLQTALALLRKASGKRGYLYEQPWYVIIGPPGAGKTTALLNAGLRFPLADELGMGAVAGVGGTRLCDWWFTEEAVLIDTAGRYTTQDSDAAVDRAGWHGFLDLLRRTRTRQPLNGVIVAIAVNDIAEASPEERLAHARAIRSRLRELAERLGLKLPVYAMLTKADLIAGFTEFFDDLDRERRMQVWGTTFPMVREPAGPLAGFAAEFRALVQRLDERLIDRLQAERSPDRRAMIAGFPQQLASFEQPLIEFLQAAFGGLRLDPAPLLRGVYLTSGTQEGTPIDRLVGALARSFGLDQRRLASLRPQQGRSYFLGRLLQEVIFGEAMLAVENPVAVRRRRMLQISGHAAALALLLLCGGMIWQGRAAGQQEVDRTAAAVAQLQNTAASLPLEPVADADLRRVAPLLDQVRDLPHGYAESAEATRWDGLGLSQTAKLSSGVRALYRQTLDRVLLPRLLWRLEAQIRGNLNRPDLLYEATRVYLMLGAAGPLDRSLVRDWMTLDWQATYPGAINAPLREDVTRHLDALLRQKLPEVALDGGLVATARTAFSRVPLAQRVYSRIRPSAAAQAVPPWRPADALGPAGVRVFIRPSGKPLTDGVPGFFTVAGFHNVLLPALAPATKEVASESWVLGQRAEIDPNSPELQHLEHDVIALYEADYARAWDAMLADVEPVPLRSIPQATQDLYILSSPQSPMRDLLASVVRQLTLSHPPSSGSQGAVQQVAANAQQAVSGAEARLQSAFGTAPTQAAVPPGQEIDDRYKALRDFVGSGPGAPIDTALKATNDLQVQLAKLGESTGAPPVAATGDDPTIALRAAALQSPPPISRWLQVMVVSGSALRGGGTKQQVAAAFNGSGGPASLCRQAVAGRYPFSPSAASDVPLDDFARLFATGGLIDGFFNTELRPYVDTSGPTWHAKAVAGVAPPVSAGELAQFQRAAQIRDLFFAPGGNTPSIRFDITPDDLDPGARQVTIDFGGTVVSYAHGPARATEVTWPGGARAGNVRLVFDPPAPGRTGVIQASGPWAVFRLFSQGNLQRGGSSDQYIVTFQQGERRASFDLRGGSVLNPFTPGMLASFRCPSLQ